MNKTNHSLRAKVAEIQPGQTATFPCFDGRIGRLANTLRCYAVQIGKTNGCSYSVNIVRALDQVCVTRKKEGRV
jgi:hypothetical protein